MLADLLGRAVAELERAGVADPRVDAELLLGYVLGLSRGEVQARIVAGGSVSDVQQREITDAVARRAQREPLQHITGLAPFRMMELAVGPGVFVPRPETEQVAQHAIDTLAAVAVGEGSEPVAVDLGAGSGAIALALATEVPHARVVAIEKSPDALAWAERNRERIGAANLRLVQGDLAEAAELLPELLGRVSVVVSNPPYIPDDAVPRDIEVQRYDPPQALYGGSDGLDAVRALLRPARLLLHPGGTLVIEHGEVQGEAVRGLLREAGWGAVATHLDLSRRERFTTALR